jgi:hypothetical protein
LESLLRKNQGERKMRRTILVVVVGALLVVPTAGAAIALNQISCNSFSQNPLTPECSGTPQEDLIECRDARDMIYAVDGDDVLKDRRAKRDHDELRGGEGNDIVNAYDGDVLDIVVCGLGTDDTAIFDVDSVAGSDSVSDSCEHKVPR